MRNEFTRLWRNARPAPTTRFLILLAGEPKSFDELIAARPGESANSRPCVPTALLWRRAAVRFFSSPPNPMWHENMTCTTNRNFSGTTDMKAWFYQSAASLLAFVGLFVLGMAMVVLGIAKFTYCPWSPDFVREYAWAPYLSASVGPITIYLAWCLQRWAKTLTGEKKANPEIK